MTCRNQPPGTWFGAMVAALGTVLPPIAYAALIYPDAPSRVVLVLLTVLGGLAAGGLWLAFIALVWRREPAPDEERADAHQPARESAWGDR